MQNDFIDGALGTKEAVAIVPNVLKKIQNFDGKIIFTRDTHETNYMDTQEGRNLPVPHCIRGTDGWEICKELAPYATHIVDKPTFGSRKLGELFLQEKDAACCVGVTKESHERALEAMKGCQVRVEGE